MSLDRTDQLKKALIALKDLRTKLDAMEAADQEPIAIIGLGCRLPHGVVDADSYWQLLSQGIDASTEIPAERWPVERYYDADPNQPGKMYTRRGNFIDQVDQFDADFFGISPREATSLDPQQRLLLEVAWEALENAGQAIDQLAGSATGVFVGVSTQDYLQHHMHSGDPGSIDAYAFTGCTASVVSGRLSYTLGLQGPSLTVDTACSSSLTAIHLACQSLRKQECTMALAGGVNLILAPETNVYFCKVKALAEDGRCKTFDAEADGYARGEGCGVVVLKRLSDAIAANDPILAVVRGSAINQDGHSNGLTAPNGRAQEQVIRQALTNAALAPHQVSYVEAHGTGTVLGDPIELQALGAALKRTGGQADERASEPLQVGSVKTNIGHLEAAAGVAGLIKVVLALQHQKIPPHLHLQQPNPHIPWAQLPITVPTQLTPWHPKHAPRIAGVSAFGMSGTNAHIILAEGPMAATEANATTSETSETSETNPPIDEAPYLLPLSARSPKALIAQVAAMKGYLTNTSAALPDICYTASVRRTHHRHRLAMVGKTAAELITQLDQTLTGDHLPQSDPTRRRQVAFVFSGQGSQWIGMGQQLIAQAPIFRAAIEQCDRHLQQHVDWSLLTELAKPEATSRLHETEIAQPAIVAIQVALVDLWKAWGITPKAVVGHSVGEITAAYVAGVLTLAQALALVIERAQLMQQATGQGKMALIKRPADQVSRQITGEASLVPAGSVHIAAINSPTATVISGDAAAIDTLVEHTQQAGVFARSLKVNYAFHCPQMVPYAQALTQSLKQTAAIQPQKATLLLASTVTGGLSDGLSFNAEHWGDGVQAPVQFASAVQALVDAGCDLFVEVGPHPVLLPDLQDCFNTQKTGQIIGSMRRNADGAILKALGTLYELGQTIHWPSLYADVNNCVDLPAYPWQRKRYWRERGTWETRLQANSAEASDRTVDSTGLQNALQNGLNDLYEIDWQPQSLPSASSVSTQPMSQEDCHWLILAETATERATVAQALTQALEAQHQSVTVAVPAETFEQTAAVTYLNGNEASHFEQLLATLHPERSLKIVYLWSLDHPTLEGLSKDDEGQALEQLAASQHHDALSLITLIQTLAGRSVPAQLWLVTQGAQPVTPGYIRLEQSTLWGLGRAIAQEHPDLWGGLIDLDPAGTAADAAGQLSTEFMQSSTEDDQLAYRQGQRYRARLQSLSLPATPSSITASITAEATYLITGGLGALGLEVAQWLVSQGAQHLLLLSRREPSAQSQAHVDKLKKAGATVTVAAADVSDFPQLQSVFSNIPAQYPLRGIIHAAGILDDGVLLNQTWARFEAVLQPKVTGAWNLHRLSQDQPLEFFVMFSSIASLLGSAGQSNYSVANAFLDALAHYRKGQGLAALSINWGPWATRGMATSKAVQRGRWRRENGVHPLSPTAGMALLAQAIGQPKAQLGAMDLRWEPFLNSFPQGQIPPLLSAFAEQYSQQPSPQSSPQNALQQTLLALPQSERLAALIETVKAQVIRVLQRDQADVLDVKRPLQELGLDSLMAIELRTTLGQLAQQPLPAALIFDYPTVTGLAQAVGQAMGVLGDHAATPTGPETMAPESAKAGTSPSTLAQGAEPIAIIGMSCRFPGAPNLEAFWDLLCQGKDAIQEIPTERWNVDKFYDPELSFPGTMNTRWGGFIQGVDQFDPYLFGISASEARSMDPQQRLLLEVSWEALEQSGYRPNGLAGSQTGIFTGISTWDYFSLQAEPPPRGGTGMALSIAANRLSYLLDLRGPSMAVDTACSSSLVAIDLACQSLRSGSSNMALAGGVNIILSPVTTIACSQAGMMAADGHCKTFDSRADGYVRGEGCGVVALKRLCDAQQDGDRILAIIRGSAVNQDGRSNGLTAPNGLAQQAVIRQAHQRAGTTPGQVSYVEAHGTGTSLGDLIEVESLWQVLQQERSSQAPCWIGSVKTNIGHLEAAAGIAGLIRLVLAMSREWIPPHLNVETVNPALNLNETQLKIPTTGQPWQRQEQQPRIAGVSSFGFGGTNVHVVLEESPKLVAHHSEASGPDRPVHVLTLSARSEKALQALIENYQKSFNATSARLSDICYTANVGRAHFSHRLAIVTTSMEQLQQTLSTRQVNQTTGGIFPGQVDLKHVPKVAFFCPDSNAHWQHLSKQLYQTQPHFQAALNQCNEHLKAMFNLSLLDQWPEEASSHTSKQTANRVYSPELYQAVACFTVEYALAQLWQAWGVKPALITGEGVGKYVAACLAGMVSLEDGLRLVVEAYGRGGQKKSQKKSQADSVAATPTSLTVSTLAHQKISQKIAWAVPQIPVFSARTGRLLTHELTENDVISDVFSMEESPSNQPSLIEQVLIEKGCQWNLALGTKSGTGHHLSPQPESDNEQSPLHLPSLSSEPSTDWAVLLETLSTLYQHGIEIDWAGFDQGYERQRVSLPTYPFDHKRYWLDPSEMKSFSELEIN